MSYTSPIGECSIGHHGRKLLFILLPYKQGRAIDVSLVGNFKSKIMFFTFRNEKVFGNFHDLRVEDGVYEVPLLLDLLSRHLLLFRDQLIFLFKNSRTGLFLTNGPTPPSFLPLTVPCLSTTPHPIGAREVVY